MLVWNKYRQEHHQPHAEYVEQLVGYFEKLAGSNVRSAVFSEMDQTVLDLMLAGF